MVLRRRRTRATRLTWRDRRRGRRERGQALVEFSLVLFPFLLLLLALVQFAFVFQAWITMNSAVRDAARDAALYAYDKDSTQTANDLARNNLVRTYVRSRFNGINPNSPNFATGTSWTTTTSGTTITATNGDLRVVYTLPTSTTDSDPRSGWRMTITATYHQDVIVPIVSAFIPKDSGGRLSVPAEVTVMIN
jgi:Flp pilus assembly protein TadG